MNRFTLPNTPNIPKWAVHTTRSQHPRRFTHRVFRTNETLRNACQAHRSFTNVRQADRKGVGAERPRLIVLNSEPLFTTPYLHTPSPLLPPSFNCGFVSEKRCHNLFTGGPQILQENLELVHEQSCPWLLTSDQTCPHEQLLPITF